MLSQKVGTSAVAASAGRRAAVVCRAQAAAPADGAATAEPRLRLHNLSPQDGSRRQNKRKGRGYGGHQGGTCGFGTRGQKSRSGSGTRPGFEGGQTSLYRRLPKLRGICGGMPAGVADHVVVNLDDLEAHFSAGEEVTLDALVAKGVLHVSGTDERLPLKVLGGGGALTKALSVKAGAFSASAADKIAAAGGSADVQAGRAKWTRRAYERAVAAAKADGKDLVADRLKEKKAKKVAKAAAAAKAKAPAASA